MTPELRLLLSLVAVGAGWMLVHLMLLVRATRAPQLARGLRWLAWLPPAAPVVAWLAGARVLPVMWVLLAAIYAWLRGRV